MNRLFPFSNKEAKNLKTADSYFRPPGEQQLPTWWTSTTTCRSLLWESCIKHVTAQLSQIAGSKWSQLHLTFRGNGMFRPNTTEMSGTADFCEITMRGCTALARRGYNWTACSVWPAREDIVRKGITKCPGENKKLWGLLLSGLKAKLFEFVFYIRQMWESLFGKHIKTRRDNGKTHGMLLQT